MTARPHRQTTHHAATVRMATEALDALPDSEVLALCRDRIAAMSDDLVTQFANETGRIPHERMRDG